MNKKFSTLLAGLLLAGGALSSVMAQTKISDVADDGTYYKVKFQSYYNTSDEWATKNGDFYLASSFTNTESEVVDSAAMVSADYEYWKVEINDNGAYELYNLEGERLAIGYKKDASFTSSSEDDNGYSQLVGATSGLYVAYSIPNRVADSYYPLTIAELTVNGEVSLIAVDFVETSLVEVADYDANIVNGGTYRLYYSDGVVDGTILKAAEGTSTWSFTVNATGDIYTMADASAFTLVTVGDDALLQTSSGKYVSYDGLSFSLVEDIESATLFAFAETGADGPITAGELSWYESDGFSVSIVYGSPEKTLSGDVISGTHWIPRAWNGSTFTTADEASTSFYLAYKTGSSYNYLVAYNNSGEGEIDSESILAFKIVPQDTLIHNLTRAAQGLEDQLYFGVFQAYADEGEYEADKEALTEIVELDVLVSGVNAAGDETDVWAVVGRYDFSGVPTLAAAIANDESTSGTDLKEITIKLGGGEVVDWKDLLQMGKFFTVYKTGTGGGTLGVADFSNIAWRSSYGNELETQFALTLDEDMKYYVFTNRESPSVTWSDIPVASLYKTDTEYTYKWNGTTYVIKPVASVDEADGYARFTDSQLNLQYHVAYSSDVYGLAYLTENHGDKNTGMHVIGLDTDEDEALIFNVKKYNAARYTEEDKSTHIYEYYPTDSIYVISELGYYNTTEKAYDTTKDTLKVVTYSFVNQYVEPLKYGYSAVEEGYVFYSDVYSDDNNKTKYANVAEAHAVALKFAVREDGDGTYNLRPIVDDYWKGSFSETDYVDGAKTDEDLYQVFYEFSEDISGAIDKVYAGDATLGVLDVTGMYDRTENDLFVIEESSSEVYRRLKNEVDTVSIYRNDNVNSLLYEKVTEIEEGVYANFLGLENIADYTEMAPAMIADTAYVRYDTYMPQYMLVVDPEITPAGNYCPIHGANATCEHATYVAGWVTGRYLVNLADSANTWAASQMHVTGNPYTNSEGYNKLGFVQATHLNDSLYIEGDEEHPIYVGDNTLNYASYALRYVDLEDESFVIETLYAVENDGTKTPGYLKWMNGVVVVVDDIDDADIFNINEDESRLPTANEAIEAATGVKVIGGKGTVTVQGASGKAVTITNILGKTVSSATLTSDNATLTVPAGIVVVAVEGEDAVKVIVK